MTEYLSMREELKAAIRAEPFVPFTLVMSSGDRYHVDDPYAVAFLKLVMVVLTPQGSRTLRLSELVAIESSAPHAV